MPRKSSEIHFQFPEFCARNKNGEYVENDDEGCLDYEDYYEYNGGGCVSH